MHFIANGFLSGLLPYKFAYYVSKSMLKSVQRVSKILYDLVIAESYVVFFILIRLRKGIILISKK